MESDEQVTIRTSWSSFCKVFEDGISCCALDRISLRTSPFRMLDNERFSPPIEVFQLQPRRLATTQPINRKQHEYCSRAQRNRWRPLCGSQQPLHLFPSWSLG